MHGSESFASTIRSRGVKVPGGITHCWNRTELPLNHNARLFCEVDDWGIGDSSRQPYGIQIPIS